MGALALFGLPAGLAAVPYHHNWLQDPNDLPPEFPAHDRATVQEVVGAAHGRFDRLKELVTARPELAKAALDWGFGDWESALGAASHMGRRDIAEFLIEYGARPDIFTFAMLGNLDAVRSMIEGYPGIQSIHGPHGITLLRHAEIRLRHDDLDDQDRRNVQAVVDYLTSVGGADEPQTSLDISDEEQKTYLGDYVFGPEAADIFHVTLNSRGMLFIRRDEQVGRVLLRVEDHGFAPGGAPSVRVRFAVADGTARSLTVHDPEPLVTAVRR